MKFINVRIIILTFASFALMASIFTSCQKDSLNNKEKESLTLNRSDSNDLPIDYLDNSNNPFNSAGIYHNDITLNSGALEANTLEEMVSLVSSYTNETNLTLNYLIENGLSVDYEGESYTVHHAANISEDANDIVLTFTETALNEELSFEATMLEVINLENEVLDNSNYSESDQESLLSMLAIFRHSGSLWYNSPPISSDEIPSVNWREVALADAIGAIAGIGFGPGSAIVSAAFSLLDIYAQKRKWRRKLILGIYEWLFGG